MKANENLLKVRRKQLLIAKSNIHKLDLQIQELENFDVEPANEEIVFLFNDAKSPQYLPNGFTPTANTYVVAYHLYKRTPI